MTRDLEIQQWPIRLLVVIMLAVATAAPQSVPAEAGLEAHLGKGYDALKQEQYDVAAGEFRAALAVDPKLTLRARFPLAVALFELHQADDARREFETVRREVGDHPNVLYYLGRMDLDAHDFAGAIANLKEAATKPPFPDTAYYLGYAYFKQGNLTIAEKWLKEAAQAAPQDSRVSYQLSLIYRKLGRGPEAKKELALSEELRRKSGSESQLRMECGKKLDQGLREEAHTVCEQLYDANNAEKLTALGAIYGQHGDLEAALRPLQRAAELAPESPQVQYNLALAYYQMNRFAEAKAPLAGAIKRWPDLFQVNALYGAVLAKLGEELPAYQALQNAHRLNPQDAATGDLLFLTTLGLGRKAQAAGEYTNALSYFEAAAKQRPQEASPHRGMADVYTLTGHPEQAAGEQQESERLSEAADRPR